jgi:hypothetical protein
MTKILWLSQIDHVYDISQKRHEKIIIDQHSLMLLTRVYEAHFSIMHQLVVMRPYIEKHLLEHHERIQDKALIMKQRSFIS